MFMESTLIKLIIISQIEIFWWSANEINNLTDDQQKLQYLIKCKLIEGEHKNDIM